MSDEKVNHTYLDIIENKKSIYSLSSEEKQEISNKIDNFLEALYICPEMFDNESIHLLKLREQKLREWRWNGTLIGGTTFVSLYLLNNIRKRSGFYFKNFTRLVFGTIIFSYFIGRYTEYLGNKWYYEKIITKLALAYNVTDSEISDLHVKTNEMILKENKDQQRSSSLDKVKFKL
jgi:hypothetical protein